MANVRWVGGQSAVTQVSTITLTTFNDSETDVTVTLTAEDGSTTQGVSITPSGTNEETIAASLQAALTASQSSMFQQVTWTQAAHIVTGTAKNAGIPFYASTTVTGGTGAAADADSQANVGPNDWNTAANWDIASIPVSGDDVWIHGEYDIIYGLDQNAVDLDNLRVTAGYSGNIGQGENGYYLRISVSNAAVTTPQLTYMGQGSCWIKGAIDNVVVGGGALDANMLRIGATSTVLNIRTFGNAKGRVYLENGVVFGKDDSSPSTSERDFSLVMEAPACTVEFDESMTIGNASNAHITTGKFISRTAWNTASHWVVGANARCEVYEGSAGTPYIGSLDLTGYLKWTAEGNLTVLDLHNGGVLDATDVAGKASVALGATSYLYGGEIRVKGGAEAVTLASGAAKTVLGGRIIEDLS